MYGVEQKRVNAIAEANPRCPLRTRPSSSLLALTTFPRLNILLTRDLSHNDRKKKKIGGRYAHRISSVCSLPHTPRIRSNFGLDCALFYILYARQQKNNPHMCAFHLKCPTKSSATRDTSVEHTPTKHPPHTSERNTNP